MIHTVLYCLILDLLLWLVCYYIKNIKTKKRCVHYYHTRADGFTYVSFTHIHTGTGARYVRARCIG
jgi:hypothetical protein